MSNPTVWTKLPSEAVLNKTVAALQKRNFTVLVVNSRTDALTTLKNLVPSGAKVMTGSSTTLYQIGFMDYYLSGKTPWKTLGPEVYLEKDPQKQAILRRLSTTADYFLASVNAVAQTGELVACDASGSRVGAFPFAADKLVLVVGYQKICPTLVDAMQRIREYVFPLEDARALKAYGVHSMFGKWVIVENEKIPGRVTVILVKEALGF